MVVEKYRTKEGIRTVGSYRCFVRTSNYTYKRKKTRTDMPELVEHVEIF